MQNNTTFPDAAIGAPSNVSGLERRIERFDVLIDDKARRLSGLAEWHHGQIERLERMDRRCGLLPESRVALGRSRREVVDYEDRAREIERLAHADRRTFRAALDGARS